MQPPHTGEDEARLAARWREVVQDVFAQALVRCLDEDEIESIIPEDLRPFFQIEEHGDDFVVRVIRERDGIGILQEICNSDGAKMREVREAELVEADAELGDP